ncbi:MAG TPA: alanine racemase [Thermoanaerobaculia bacterium]|jgi:alanine racemase
MSTAPDLSTLRPTWVDIDGDAFSRNIDAVIRRLPEGSQLIAVMKANAYGHGAVELAKRCRPDRVAMIAVIMLEEALELRRAGITLPVLILGPLTPTQVAIAADNNFVIGVPGPEELQAIANLNREVHIHLKLDSGMGRMGITEAELPHAIEILRSSERIKLDALYTHFANASDPDDHYTEQQTANFDRLVTVLRDAGVTAPRHHRANSAATMRGLVRPGEYVRVGLFLYGADPLDGGGSRLEPVMRWRTEVARIKTLPAGHPVGYGETFHTVIPSRVATLPVGYADGYSRLLSNLGEVLVRGRRARVVGRVSMDLVTIDVTAIPGVTIGDEVVLLGDTITAEEIAAKIGTISHEVFCSVSTRVPRVVRDGTSLIIRSRFA